MATAWLEKQGSRGRMREEESEVEQSSTEASPH